MRRGFVNPPRTPREHYYASRQKLQMNYDWNKRNKQFQQYCTARREKAYVEDKRNYREKTTENNRRWYKPPNVQQKFIYRDKQNNWNNEGQNVNYNRWYKQHVNVDHFDKSIVLGTLCVLTKVHENGQRKKLKVIINTPKRTEIQK